MKYIVSLLLLFTSLATLAQTAVTNVVTVSPPVPMDVPGIWTLVIAVLTPLIIQGIKLLIPRVPRAILPILTPIVGIIFGLLINWVASKNLGWVDMAQAGALAVFVREVVNQNVTRRIATPEQPAAPIAG